MSDFTFMHSAFTTLPLVSVGIENKMNTVKIHDLLVDAQRVGRHASVLTVVRMIDVVDPQTPDTE